MLRERMASLEADRKQLAEARKGRSEQRRAASEARLGETSSAKSQLEALRAEEERRQRLRRIDELSRQSGLVPPASRPAPAPAAAAPRPPRSPRSKSVSSLERARAPAPRAASPPRSQSRERAERSLWASYESFSNRSPSPQKREPPPPPKHLSTTFEQYLDNAPTPIARKEIILTREDAVEPPPAFGQSLSDDEPDLYEYRDSASPPDHAVVPRSPSAKSDDGADDVVVRRASYDVADDASGEASGDSDAAPPSPPPRKLADPYDPRAPKPSARREAPRLPALAPRPPSPVVAVVAEAERPRKGDAAASHHVAMALLLGACLAASGRSALAPRPAPAPVAPPPPSLAEAAAAAAPPARPAGGALRVVLRETAVAGATLGLAHAATGPAFAGVRALARARLRAAAPALRAFGEAARARAARLARLAGEDARAHAARLARLAQRALRRCRQRARRRGPVRGRAGRRGL